MTLSLEGVEVSLAGAVVVRDVDLVLAEGEIVGLVGPNGSGKSTLLRSMYRALRPSAGLISLDGTPLDRLSARETARRIAVVPQEQLGDFEFTVAQVVAMGRTPHKGPLDRDTDEDRAICTEALERVGLLGSEERLYATLSGGEKQRALIARSLAQRCRIHLLDEPTNHLDIRYQLEILELVRSLGHTTVAAIHDLNLAAAFCDRILVVSAGTIVADGEPAKVLTPELIADIFGVRARSAPHPDTDRPVFVFDLLTG